MDFVTKFREYFGLPSGEQSLPNLPYAPTTTPSALSNGPLLVDRLLHHDNVATEIRGRRIAHAVRRYALPPGARQAHRHLNLCREGH